jgi:hypothetical protein
MITTRRILLVEPLAGLQGIGGHADPGVGELLMAVGVPFL